MGHLDHMQTYPFLPHLHLPPYPLPQNLKVLDLYLKDKRLKIVQIGGNLIDYKHMSILIRFTQIKFVETSMFGDTTKECTFFPKYNDVRLMVQAIYQLNRADSLS